jgi:hypothetical protein
MNVWKRVIGGAEILFLVIAAVCTIASATMKDYVSGARLVYYGHGGRLPLVAFLNNATPERPKVFC